MLKFSTERLYLREMTQNDFPALSRILRDPEVMYAYEGAFTEAETQAWLDNQFRRYAETGMGLWAVCSIIRDTNRASQKVAERNGMKRMDSWVKYYHGVDMPHFRYEISRADWEKLTGG